MHLIKNILIIPFILKIFYKTGNCDRVLLNNKDRRQPKKTRFTVKINLNRFKVTAPGKFKLSNHPANYTARMKSKEDAKADLEANVKSMAEMQDMMYAHDKWGLLILFQAMDAAGKDGAIKHVMSGVNPQGTQVFSFKVPSAEELDHDYLWRYTKALPERGRIGIFNRSYYEEVLVVKVHNLLQAEKLPDPVLKNDIWKNRYVQIKNFEKYLNDNGIKVLKFFLNVSKDEQKRRFLERIDNPAKNWKFSSSDLKERGYWDQYQKAYEEAIANTSTKYAPWHIIPADKKWFARLIISEIITEKLKELKVHYPVISDEHRQNLASYKEALMAEE